MQGLIRFAGVQFDFDGKTLHVDGQAVHLELKQSLVLIKLLSDSPRLVTKEQLLDFGWPGVATGDDVLAVAISHLRKALGDSVRSPRFIKTVAGQGYQWVGPLSARARHLARHKVYGDESKPSRSNRRPVVYAGLAVLFAVLIAVWQLRNDPLSEAARMLHAEDAEQLRQALAIYEAAWESGIHSTEVLQGMVDAQWGILQQQPVHLYQASDELRAWLERALEIEPENPGIHRRLAQLEFYVAWNPDAAYDHYEQAIALDPDNADSHLALCYLQLAMGEFGAASASLAAARSVDPRHYAREMAAWIYNMQRNYEQAKLELERLVEIRPDTLTYHVSAQSVFENSGDHGESFEHLARTLELFGYGPEQLDQARQNFMQSGLSGVYRWLLEDVRETRNIGQYRPPLAHARYAISAGDIDAAFDYLEEALAERQYELLWINVDPKYDPLRSDPRFEAIVRSVGIPHQ